MPLERIDQADALMPAGVRRDDIFATVTANTAEDWYAGVDCIDALLGRTYPLAAVNEAYAALTGGAVGRAVVVPGQ
jgi:hypothetical protein